MEAPPIPAEEIIRRFAEKETQFKRARENYSYRQTVIIRDYTNRGRLMGELRRISDFTFRDDGRRVENIISEPTSTLRRFHVTREDISNIESILPFSLTAEELPQYLVEYLGREKVDEIGALVFSVRPRRVEKNRHYFQGTVWVDDADLLIVKVRGKRVPDIRDGPNENLFPTFEMYREPVDGENWFPTYLRGDDTLRYADGFSRITVMIRYSDYKKRGEPVGGEKATPPPDGSEPTTAAPRLASKPE